MSAGEWSVQLMVLTGRCVGNGGNCKAEPTYSALLDYCGITDGWPAMHPIRTHDAVVDCQFSDDDVLLCETCARRVRSFDSLVSMRSYRPAAYPTN